MQFTALRQIGPHCGHLRQETNSYHVNKILLWEGKKSALSYVTEEIFKLPNNDAMCTPGSNFSLVDLRTAPRKLHKNSSRHLNLSKNLRFVKINRARRERMFYITTSSPSFFVCCTRCTADALQSVCIGKHNHSYRQNSKGKTNCLSVDYAFYINCRCCRPLIG